MTGLAGVLLLRSAEQERAQLEARLVQVAEDLAAEVDRELSNLVTVLTTLATSPALQKDDLASFHAQAVAATRGWASLFLVDPHSMQQMLNTLVPWGTELPKTGDVATVTRVRETQRAQVSDYFVGVVSKRGAVDVDIPVMRDGNLKYVMLLGLDPDHFVPMLKRQKLNAEWVLGLVDRNNILIARSREHEKYGGTRYVVLPEASTDTKLVRSRDLEGRDVLRAVVKSKISGWSVVASIPVAVAQAPLSTTLTHWAVDCRGLVVFGVAVQIHEANSDHVPSSKSTVNQLGVVTVSVPSPKRAVEVRSCSASSVSASVSIATQSTSTSPRIGSETVRSDRCAFVPTAVTYI
jgi:hypothetical protein